MTLLFKQFRRRLPFRKWTYYIKRYLIKIGFLYEWKYSFEEGGISRSCYEKPKKERLVKKKVPKVKKPKKVYFRDLKIKYKKFIKTPSIQERIKEWKSWLILVASYGIIINYMCYIIFGCVFSWYTFWAYGIVYYLFKEELPSIVQHCRGSK